MSRTTAHGAGFTPTFGLLCELLGADPDCPPAELLHRARDTSFTLPPLLLSVADHEGHRLGTGSRDELDRHRARLATYAGIASSVRGLGTRVVKGPALAHYLPSWVVRTSGDLDLLAPDEPTLWRTARAVTDRLPVDDVQLTLTGRGPGGHLMIGLSAPTAEPWLDPELKVEIATYAYPGDCETVPPRALLPADDAVAQLLAVAEERFQREFTVRDVLDCTAVLASPRGPEPDALAAAAAEWRLAPELDELIGLARGFPSVAKLLGSGRVPALAGATSAERERRDRLRPGTPDGPPGETAAQRLRRRLASGGDVSDRLRDGFPVFGMPLETACPAGREDRARLHDIGDGMVLTTPLGAFLLVSQELVDPGQYRRAQEFASRLTTEQSATGTPWGKP